MKHASAKTISMANQFRRDYLFVAIVPLLFLFILVVLGAAITRNYLAQMIVRATDELNQDAEQSLQKLGERIIRIKARDVAKQLEIYFRMHPYQNITEMRKDPHFMELAIQQVGQTGYTAITEAETYLFRVHPNAKLNDRDMRFLAEKMPSWWKIVQGGISGVEAAGYYDWIEPDGSVRKKFLVTTPIKLPLNGITMMASATTYIDEFSTPMVAMGKRANAIVGAYQRYVSQQWLVFNGITAALISLTFIGTCFLGRKAAQRYIVPIVQLAESAREFGEGKRNIDGLEKVLDRQDEIGTLAQAFNRTSMQLVEMFNRLEQRVGELNQTQAALSRSEAHYKLLYEESKRREELYRSLIHSSADAIAIYDLEGNARYVSPMFTKIFGWREEELIGRRIPFVPESEKVSTDATISDILNNGTLIHGFETKRATKEGQMVDVSISASRFDDHERRPAGMLVILRDISEKKRLEAQIQHIERMEAIGTLAGGIAHDFNNLLMVIQGNATMLLTALDPTDSIYKHLQQIETQVQRGAKLTSQLLGYARKGKYEVKAVNLNDVVRENAETFRRTRKDISFHFDLSPELRPIEVDVHQIEQVLMNLFINASDAMPEGGDLFIKTQNVKNHRALKSDETEPPEDLVLISVEDTGIGMNAKVKERIFDPFFTTKEMGRGTGLGLASVYGIIKSHGGHIEVESAEGQGTIFTIYLPASDNPLEVLANPAKEIPKGIGTILLIDDEEIVLDIGAKLVEALGYNVIKATSAQMALEIFKVHSDHIDLVILDMVMPDIGGGIAFDRIRAIDPQAAVILSSGYSIDGKAREILNRGCRGFIQKPYTMEQLAEKLQTTITQKGNKPVPC